MRRCTFAIVLLIAFLAFPAAVSADMTYILNSFAADQNGWTLTGSITTDGTIGVLAKSDFVSWTWTVTEGSSSSTYSSTDAALLYDQGWEWHYDQRHWNADPHPVDRRDCQRPVSP